MTATRTSFVTTKDGAEIFFKDWGSGRPIVFSHGWPLNADIWDDQLLYFSRNGFRAVAPTGGATGALARPPAATT
jgi:non-heme chloroperoxidase